MSLRNVILVGDVLDRLREIPDESVHCVVTSPPYWGLRDFGIELNPAYAEMARNRIEHGTVDPSEVSEIESQGMLFDMSNSNIMQSPAQEADHAAP